ncbi:MAG TPA: hypothetical protein VM122_06675 [Usitatibacter sp.]|nr:hypothetical protein [Usitatibacter sp.]
MSSRHFLYLTNTRLVSITTRGKRIVMRREFAVSGAGAAEFERYLAALVDVPTHLFTDLTEEDFRLDTVPHVGAKDRGAIVERKLTQMFRNTPFRHAQLQGRETEGRRDDRVLYTAVTNPEVLRPWLDAIERLKLPLAGIHSAAVFSAVLLEELDLAFPHTLLVTFTPGEAMRQTYLREREIKFSRLTPVDLEPGQSLGSMVAEETTRTWQYLDSLRHFAPEDRLEVCVMLHPSERAAVQPELRDFAQIQYRILDIEQVAAKLGLKPPPLGSSAEEVMVHLFLLRPAENHFAAPEIRRYSTLRRARLALNQASAVIIAASLVWAAWNLAGIFKANDADSAQARQIAALNRDTDEITRALPSFGVGGSTMRDAVTFYNGAIRPFPGLAEFLRPISTVLQAHDGVRLSQLSWQATDNEKAVPALLATPPRLPPPVKAMPRSGDVVAGSQPTEDPNPPFAGGRYEVAVMEATVRVASNDFRAALDEVERLAADIARMPGFQADVLDSPLDTRPSQALQGRHGERDPPQMEPRFTLRIVRDRGAPA